MLKRGQVSGTGLVAAALVLWCVTGEPASSQAATVGVITSGGTPVVDVASTGLFSPGVVTQLYPQGATPVFLDGEGEPL